MKPSLLLLFLLIGNVCFSQQAAPKGAFLEKWENSKIYLIEIAETMPDSLYDYKPTPRQMSFKEQLIHIKGNMEWLGTTHFSTVEFNRDKTPIPKSKAETIALLSKAFDKVSTQVLNASGDELKQTVNFFSGPKSKLQILNLLQDHVTHHRGQLIVYLNLLSLDPPSYVGW